MLVGNKSKSVAIKTLVEFAAKTGSLDRKFTPSPSAQEGIQGHRRVTANRHKTYQTEIPLSINYDGITFRGRADGYDPKKHCIEEIKTFYGEFNNIPKNHQLLHWAQVRCYGWMYCEIFGCDQINLTLVYFNLADQQEYLLEESWSAIDLKKFGGDLAEKYCQWQAHIDKRLIRLTSWIKQLKFPHGELYDSQRVMAEAVYKAAALGRVLLAEAPTGTGKTLAGLFPAIKSMVRTPVDKIFYLTAKTTGKQLALDNIQLIASDKTHLEVSPLRTLELTAKEKSCLEPGKKCTGGTCTFAFNFYFKLDAARQAAYEIPLLDKSALTALAHEFKICPFYLSMEMSRWVDIVVADVNYYFDGTPLLLSLTNEFDWKPYLLIDESHNLIDRGRSMYSSELSRSDLLNAKNCAPVAIKKSLEKIDTSWIELINTFPKDVENFYLLPTTSDKMNQAITEFTSIYIEFLQKNPEHPVQESFVQNFFFSSLNYQGLLEILDEDFCIDMQSIGTKKEILTLRNLIPATPLSRRLSAAHCACYFSATLHPPYYYQSLLGLPEDTAFIKVPSPFKPEQLDIKIANTLSTRYKDRESSLAPMCKIIEQQISEAPGNALIFFPSYDFLKKVELVLGSTLKDSNVRMLVQSNRMNEIDRQEFIEQFSSHNNLLGLAVLGGAFSEGIDLSGDALKGVFIATLGLPQVNPINEYLRSVMQTKFLRGYDFTYTYPGIQKVVQAAGRVIRTKNDTGYLWLLDERYEQQDIRHLLPDWWNLP